MSERDEERVHPSAPPASPRDALVARFAAWLDRTLAAEAPPSGVPAELLAELAATGDRRPDDADESDLHTLWSAMVALTQEVKLQGRSFDRLRESLGDVSELPAAARGIAGAHEEAVAAAEGAAQAAQALRSGWQADCERRGRERAGRERVDSLLDVRDGLVRGRAVAEDHLERTRGAIAGSWWLRRRFGRVARGLLEATASLARGYALGMARLDQLLEELGVSEIEAEGKPFAAALMCAVGFEERDEGEDGTVVEVVRPGYRRRGEVLRVAQVRVVRCRVVRCRVVRRPATGCEPDGEERSST